MATTVYIPAADPAVRRSGIGSSDAAVVAGLNRWKTPLDLYLEKRGLVEPEPASEAAEWGTILEPTILREFARRNGVHVIGRWIDGGLSCYGADGWIDPGGFINGLANIIRGQAWYQAAELLDTLRHRDRPWMMCHLDGVLIDPESREIVGVLEAKTAGASRGWEWGEEGSDEIPEEYLIQVQHAAEVVRSVFGRTLPCHVAVLIGGQRWRQYRVEHDPALVASLIEIEAEFWRRVEAGDPPPAEPDERGARALARLYPQHEDTEIVAAPGSDLDALARELAEAKAALAAAEARVTAAEVAIKEKMGAAGRVVGDGWSATWRTQTRRTVDYAAVVREAGVPHDLIERHTRETHMRVFRFSERKGD